MNTKIILTTALLSLALVGCGSTNEVTTKEPAVEEKTAEVKEAPKPKIEDVGLTSEAITPILKDRIVDVDKVEIKDGKVTVNFSTDKTYWDETDIASSTARQGVTLMEMLFKNADVKSVELVTPTSMMDETGNEKVVDVVKVTWDRAISDEVNYANFSDMMYVEFPRFYNVATSYYIHPGVFNNIKSDELPLFKTGFQKE